VKPGTGHVPGGGVLAAIAVTGSTAAMRLPIKPAPTTAAHGKPRRDISISPAIRDIRNRISVQ